MGGKVDVVRLRAKMNATLKQRIERDAIYVCSPSEAFRFSLDREL